MECTFGGCEFISRSQDELNEHLQAHSTDSLAQWTRGSRCSWGGCTSKAVFKTKRLYQEHLRNIHTTPLLCTQPRCSYKKPFRNEDDLGRHEATKHSAQRNWECPYSSCSSEKKTFARRDKWLKHIRETQHENDAFCPFYHCHQEASGGFSCRREIVSHFDWMHATNKSEARSCALGSCGKSGGIESWSVSGLRMHLLVQHGVPAYYLPLHFRGRFGTEHVQAGVIWTDCKLCVTIVQPAAEMAVPCLEDLSS